MGPPSRTCSSERTCSKDALRLASLPTAPQTNSKSTLPASGPPSTSRLPPQERNSNVRSGKALQNIPYGQTRSYADIAAVVGNPKATRAVGSANNRNPIAVLIPCHRVVGANGKLTGYAGGLALKQRLLDLERAHR